MCSLCSVPGPLPRSDAGGGHFFCPRADGKSTARDNYRGMNKTSIAWVKNPDGTDGFTWNPFVGCKTAGEGCKNCYAARLAGTRLANLPQYAGLVSTKREVETLVKSYRGRNKGATPQVRGSLKVIESVGHWTGEVRFFPEKLVEPLRRKKPASIFVGDMGDIALLEFEQIAAIFGVMAASPKHTYHVLTKRPERLRAWFAQLAQMDGDPWTTWPLPNVRIGASVCTQADADRLIPELLQVPAALRFLSVEPLLELVRIEGINTPGGILKPLVGLNWVPTARGLELSPKSVGPKIDWVIVGGESGPGARPCNVDWIRSIVSQCAAAVTPCFVKQMTVDGKLTDDVGLFPADLRIREFPGVQGSHGDERC